MTAALEGGEWSAARPGPTLPLGKDPVPILQEAEWAPGSVWTGGKSRPHRDSIPDRPAHSQSLYRLSYRARFMYVCVCVCVYVCIYIYIYIYNIWNIQNQYYSIWHDYDRQGCVSTHARTHTYTHGSFIGLFVLGPCKRFHPVRAKRFIVRRVLGTPQRRC